MNGSITSRVPYEEYAQIDAVSITRLKELKRSPLHYQYFLNRGLPETDALRLGVAAHTATLEPERFYSQFAVWNRRGESGSLCPRRGQYWDRFVLDNPGKKYITEDDLEEAATIANRIHYDPVASKYFQVGEPEVSMQWETWVEAPMGLARMVPCRGRVDWITHLDGMPHLIGLKTSRDVRPFVFGAASHRLSYHLQWAFYEAGYLEIKGVRPVLKEIVVEYSPPHDVVVYNVPEDVIQQGREDYMALLKTWVECQKLAEWPGVGNGAELDVTLPTYAYPRTDDIGDLDLDE
jgi:hypothetical protein